jgi:hypothetical protein
MRTHALNCRLRPSERLCRATHSGSASRRSLMYCGAAVLMFFSADPAQKTNKKERSTSALLPCYRS